MENLLFYLLDELLACGEVRKNDDCVAGEDTWQIVVSSGGYFVNLWLMTRSEIQMIHDMYKERMPFMTDDECIRIEKLIAVL